ncbi:hypothetical protein BT96DRAFT_988956 [Gymnopus androsaceus JB14]|uniref:Uncharacterized protein n=1 Tax=Gymnopus androsaceus JB14 TaxID=1447944 RepID=A0A6A4I4Q0_9AGAR|nr:hypothetical protein BT96DRAFT_988956 [Gymnopus androsaceus JB14]
MPRARTASAIAKSQLTPEQKAENRKNSRAKANRNYRLRYVVITFNAPLSCRKGQKLKEMERRRMMQRRGAMDGDEKAAAKLQRKESDTKYYLKNRDTILDDARWSRINKWTDQWNGHPPGIYKCRNGSKRIGKSENSAVG